MGSMMAGAGPPNPASTAVSSAMVGQRVLQEFWAVRSASQSFLIQIPYGIGQDPLSPEYRLSYMYQYYWR
jgi:hypothetical protein